MEGQQQPSRFTVRYYFDHRDFVDQSILAASLTAATVQAEEHLNKLRHEFRDQDGSVLVLNMQAVRYFRVQPALVTTAT